jgi:hypothetical protein
MRSQLEEEWDRVFFGVCLKGETIKHIPKKIELQMLLPRVSTTGTREYNVTLRGLKDICHVPSWKSSSQGK